MPMYAVSVEIRNVNTKFFSSEEKENFLSTWIEFIEAPEPDLACLKVSKKVLSLTKKNPAAYSNPEIEIICFAEVEEEK